MAPGSSPALPLHLLLHANRETPAISGGEGRVQVLRNVAYRLVDQATASRPSQPCSVTPQAAAAFYCDMQGWYLHNSETPSGSLITTCKLSNARWKDSAFKRFKSLGDLWRREVTWPNGRRPTFRAEGWAVGGCEQMQFFRLQTLVLSHLCLFKSWSLWNVCRREP